METVSNSIEDALISGLSYKLDATASYITEKEFDLLRDGRKCICSE